MSAAVTQFEQAFARWASLPAAFAFWKGRVALYAILRALGVGDGDEIILPGYTCVMNVNPIKYVGARPVYVDIDPITYNMDPALLEAKITTRTRAIIAQHTYGYPCEMDAILAIARRRGIPVIEDCCLALGSRYKGQLCGTMGVAAYWSFQWNKPFTTGLGGVAATSDAALAAKIAELVQAELRPPSSKAALVLAAQRIVYRTLIFPRTTATATRVFRWLAHRGLLIGSSSTSEFSPTMQEGFFTGMSPGQARSGLRRMRGIEANLAHRMAMRLTYEELLRAAGFNVAATSDATDPVLVRYPVRVSDKQRAVAEAPAHGIELGTWFECPLHPIETPMAAYDYVDGMCPEGEKASREVVNLPMHGRATAAVAARSVRFLASVCPPAS